MAELTRRSFVVNGAAATVAAAGAGLIATRQSVASEPETEWDAEADVLIIGFGGAGATAAVTAAENGASVIILEKMDIVGGATSLNAGVVQAAGTSVQEAAGVNDSPDAWFECLRKEIGAGFDEARIRALVDGAPDVIDWLVELGANIPAEVYQSDTRSIPASGLYYADASFEMFPDAEPTPRGHVVEGGGAKVIELLENRALELGVDIRMATRATRLIQDESGTVIGVEAQTDDQKLRFKANKGVVIATGHFNQNEDMVRRHIPEVFQLANVFSASAVSATGDGHRMCSEIGADLVGMNNCTFSNNSVGYAFETPLHSMEVNVNCQRFWSEQGYHENYRGTALRHQPGQVGYVVFDESIRAMFDEVQPEDIAYSADTLEELAGLCGLNLAALANAVDRYNAYCEQGVDPDFGKPAAFLSKIEQAPFYAVPMGYSWMTTGGMSIDEQCRVLTADSEAIPGLYAVGMCAYGVYGETNPGSGVNMAWNFYTGKLVGRLLAAA